MTKKLLFIGGHHNSALATIDWLKNNKKDIEFAWIGKKFVHDDNISPEYSEVTAKNIPFYDLKAGKLYRSTSLEYLGHIILNLLLIPYGFIQAFSYLLQIKPDLIVSFGGYMSVPVVMMGSLLGIKSVLHEQTVTVGLANKISSYFAEKIYVSWPIELYSESSDKMEYTGLPIRESLSNKTDKYTFSRDTKTIYITGGKSGSLFINKIFLEILPKISKKYNLIWSTGRRVGEYDYKQINESAKNLQDVVIKEYFTEDEIHKVMNSADFVVTRGGAHTIYELALLKKPAIVIPIPNSSMNEQLKNGQILEKFGLAKVLEQDALTPPKLASELAEFANKIDKINENTKDKEYVPSNGQEKLGYALSKLV